MDNEKKYRKTWEQVRKVLHLLLHIFYQIEADLRCEIFRKLMLAQVGYCHVTNDLQLNTHTSGRQILPTPCNSVISQEIDLKFGML